MPDNKKHIASYEASILKDARKANNMTQQQVADKAKIDLRHYQRFEYGNRKITSASFRIAMSVFDALNINVEIFLQILKRNAYKS